MSEEIRTERSHGLKDRLDASARAALVNIRFTEGYEVILDIFERACISQETNLINCDVEDKEKIYAEFLLSKAFWQVFVSAQKMIETEVMIHRGIEQEKAEVKKAIEDFDPHQAILRVQENNPELGEDDY